MDRIEDSAGLEDLTLKELQEQARTWIYTRSDFKFRAPFDKRLAKRAGLIGESVSENPRAPNKEEKIQKYKRACARLRKKLGCVIAEWKLNSRDPPVYGHEHDWDTDEEV